MRVNRIRQGNMNNFSSFLSYLCYHCNRCLTKGDVGALIACPSDENACKIHEVDGDKYVKKFCEKTSYPDQGCWMNDKEKTCRCNINGCNMDFDSANMGNGSETLRFGFIAFVGSILLRSIL
ncbi:uncharacterized protein LOC111712177 [Eurytemora carolleeae]|uniref:uncharacterized protein LOC111712177 n=1 Tax=Eurytemora carolleeae TaxID=1294199 RepID=UPI000C757970|nr:uncharacterized protein LOC111712177 [Eurytemora carolleeae]|eukprot:XP_023342491.1 uncharacterized protein LOC111712177 [Eurytemora affinis]